MWQLVRGYDVVDVEADAHQQGCHSRLNERFSNDAAWQQMTIKCDLACSVLRRRYVRIGDEFHGSSRMASRSSPTWRGISVMKTLAPRSTRRVSTLALVLMESIAMSCCRTRTASSRGRPTGTRAPEIVSEGLW